MRHLWIVCGLAACGGAPSPGTSHPQPTAPADAALAPASPWIGTWIDTSGTIFVIDGDPPRVLSGVGEDGEAVTLLGSGMDGDVFWYRYATLSDPDRAIEVRLDAVDEVLRGRWSSPEMYGDEELTRVAPEAP